MTKIKLKVGGGNASAHAEDDAYLEALHERMLQHIEQLLQLLGDRMAQQQPPQLQPQPSASQVVISSGARSRSASHSPTRSHHSNQQSSPSSKPVFQHPVLDVLRDRLDRKDYANLHEFQVEVARLLPNLLGTVRPWIARLYQQEPLLLELSEEAQHEKVQSLVGRRPLTEVHRDENYSTALSTELQGGVAMIQRKPVKVKEPSVTKAKKDEAVAAALEAAAEQRSRRPKREAALKALQPGEDAGGIATIGSPPKGGQAKNDAEAATSAAADGTAVADKESPEAPGQGLLPSRIALTKQVGEAQGYTSLRSFKGTGALTISLPDVTVVHIPAVSQLQYQKQQDTTLSLYTRVDPIKPTQKPMTLGEICPAPPKLPRANAQLNKRKQREVIPVSYFDVSVQKSFGPQYDSSDATLTNAMTVDLALGLEARKRQQKKILHGWNKLEKKLRGEISILPASMDTPMAEQETASLTAETMEIPTESSTENIGAKESEAAATEVDMDVDEKAPSETVEVEESNAEAEPKEAAQLGPKEVAEILEKEGIDLDAWSRPVDAWKPLTSLEFQEMLEESALLLKQLLQLQTCRVATVSLTDNAFAAIASRGPLANTTRANLGKLLHPNAAETEIYSQLEKNLAQLVSSAGVKDLVSVESLDRLRSLTAFLGTTDPTYPGIIKPPSAMPPVMSAPAPMAARPPFPQPPMATATPGQPVRPTGFAPPAPILNPHQQPTFPTMYQQQQQQFVQSYYHTVAAQLQKMGQPVPPQVANMMPPPATPVSAGVPRPVPVPPQTAPAAVGGGVPPTPGFPVRPMHTPQTKSTPFGASYKCSNCGTTESVAWRAGDSPSEKLCNTCGLYYRKMNRHRQV